MDILWNGIYYHCFKTAVTIYYYISQFHFKIIFKISYYKTYVQDIMKIAWNAAKSSRQIIKYRYIFAIYNKWTNKKIIFISIENVLKLSCN